MDDYLEQAIAALMREELLYSRLDVTLAPSPPEFQPTRRRRRIVEERNPAWYRRLCREWPSNRTWPRRKRHGDTRIKRAHVLRALEELANGRCRSEYARRLHPYVQAETRRFVKEHRRHGNIYDGNGGAYGRLGTGASLAVGRANERQADRPSSGGHYPARR